MTLPIVVLAGGLATRIRPITEKIPKSLIDINGKPFVLHQLDLFTRNNIEHIHFCLGYLGQMVKEVIESHSYNKTIKITYSFDGERLLGTGGAIKKALPELPEFFFVTYGDSYLDIEYKSIETLFTKANPEGLMTIYKNDNLFDSSNATFLNNQIVQYSKTNKNNKMNYIDFGLGVLRKRAFQDYPHNFAFDLSEIYETLSLEKKLIGYESQKRFYEIGSFQGIKDLSQYLKTKNS
ncbi:MAG: Nucleotidyl transferase [Bacteroidetes bacterium]|nr:Nucleotidyl transferase [Bacteroidota bacterium]